MSGNASRTRALVYRRALKVVLESEVIRGRRVAELYVALRGRGFYVGWGGER